MNISFTPESFSKATSKGFCPNIVLIILFLEQERTSEEILKFLNISDRAFYRYLKVLDSKGYIQKRKKSFFNYYSLTEKAEELWED
jgi:predicted transcriptional regulator